MNLEFLLTLAIGEILTGYQYCARQCGQPVVNFQEFQ